MRKSLLKSFLLSLLICSSLGINARSAQVVGQALNTDIVAYINHYAIPSYAVNGTSVIIAEDLRNFGFDVTWDNDSRTLAISRNSNTNVEPMSFAKTAAPGTKFSDLYSTDIKVYANEYLLTSYALNGYTVIPIEELFMFGDVYWVADQRAIKLWVDGLQMNSEPQSIEKYSPNPAQLGTYSMNPIVDDSANYFVNVKSINGNYATINIEWIGDRGRFIYCTEDIQVALNNGYGTFNWEDSWSNRGIGFIQFSGDTVTLTMRATYTSKYNRSSMECENRVMGYRGI